MDEPFLYCIGSRSLCRPEPLWLGRLRQNAGCSVCQRLKPSVYKEGTDVYLLNRPDISALNCVMPPNPSLGIARKEFLDLFTEDIRSYLNLHKVFVGYGTLVEGYVAFAAEKQLLVRGGPRSQLMTCPECGRSHYLPIPADAGYVLRSSLTDRSLYIDKTFTSLLITEELYRRIDRRRWKGISFHKVPILDEPQDGLTQLREDLQ